MPSKARLVCVPPEAANRVWPHVREFIEGAALRTNLADADTLRDDILSGAALLWIAVSDRIEAAATTCLIKANGSLYCELTSCGGSGRDNWIQLLNEIEAYAKAEGCRALRIYGRKGWQRVLPDYQVSNIVLERRL